MSLLFTESPYLAAISLGSCIIGYFIHPIIFGLMLAAFLFLLYFYRYFPKNVDIRDARTLICPCEGTVLDIVDKDGYYYIPIFISLLDKHTQVYPAYCTVINRVYDMSGEFNLAIDLNKSKNNEKKIHTMHMYDGTVISLTQVAGLIPRVITSASEIGNYNIGDYLGMIKFGSRVDLLLPKKSANDLTLTLSIVKDQHIDIYDILGKYE